jgi:UDP-glucose 4-epimerase
MKIVVTGGAGFIGSHLVEALLAQGHIVKTLDNLSAGLSSNLQKVKHHPNHTFIQGSVRDQMLLKKTCEGCDAIFHLAAVLGVKNLVEHPLNVIEENVDGTRNVLEVAIQTKIRVIFASTSEVYGKSEQMPFREDGNRVLGPTTKHRWCYATAKALDEHLCMAYADMGLPVAIIRYFNAYGPRASSSPYGMVIPRFIRAALTNAPLHIYGTGQQTRSFTYITDIVQGTLKCLSPKADGHIFNIGTDHPLTILELAKKIRLLCGSNSPIQFIPYEQAHSSGFEDIPDRYPDITKARTVLGYTPTVDLQNGLKETIRWYQDNVVFLSDKEVNL